MQLSLTEDETRTLRDILRDFLPELRFEVARTDSHDFRHALLKRQELCERLLAELEQAG